MAHAVLRVSTFVLGAAAFVSLSPLCIVLADHATTSGAESAPDGAGPTASGATAAPSGPASAPNTTTPAAIGVTESAPDAAAPAASGATAAQSGTASRHGAAASAASGTTTAPSGVTAVQHYAHASVRYYAHDHSRYAHPYRSAYSHNPVAAVVAGVLRSAADLGSLAAYPVYCFPRYRSCRVFLPY
jgi:hypothetical protein